MLPWLIEPYADLEWRVGPYSINLPRLKLGNDFSWAMNHLVRTDLALKQQGRHRDSGMHLVFEGWARQSTTYRNRQYLLTQKAFNEYSGALSTLIFPTNRRLVGIAHNPIYGEINNCLANLEFDFVVFKEIA